MQKNHFLTVPNATFWCLVLSVNIDSFPHITCFSFFFCVCVCVLQSRWIDREDVEESGGQCHRAPGHVEGRCGAATPAPVRSRQRRQNAQTPPALLGTDTLPTFQSNKDTRTSKEQNNEMNLLLILINTNVFTNVLALNLR